MKSHRNNLVTSVDRAIEEKIATRLDGTPLDVRYQGSILLGTPNVHASPVVRLMAAVR